MCWEYVKSFGLVLERRNIAVIYTAYQMGIYSFNVIYNFTLSKMFPISLNKVQLVGREFDFENC